MAGRHSTGPAGRQNLGADDCSLLLEEKSEFVPFESFHKFFVLLIDQLNDAIVVEGCDAHVEWTNFDPLVGHTESSG